MPVVNFYPAMGVAPHTGYGRMALGIAKGLQAAGVELRLFSDISAPTLVIGHAAAFDAPHIAQTRRTAFPMLESDTPAPEIVAALNQHCERLLVCAPPLIDIFRNHGVTIPVEFVPLGVDLFPVEIAPPPSEFPFTFLTYSYGDTRKGGDIALNVFLRAFGDDERFRLVIKARDGHQLGFLSTIQHPRVQVMGGVQSEADWMQLLGSAHCFLFPSRAEGWGMPPRDATLRGVPTIATECIGLWDVAQWGIPLPVKEYRQGDFRRNPFNADEGLWAEPDQDALITKMAWVAENYAEARQIALNGRDYLLRNFSWTAMGQRLKALLLP